ncbi:hypothetical protein ABVF61_31535 [Roseibium sp. HPY-6]|uniref:hypothetical protein n=1 Tax=Roseibium sp. HPY-6 TaxID=3229852 RepID=UPI00338E9928
MGKILNINMARVLAILGLVFWAYYVIRYVFGVPLFLADGGAPSLGAQIAFLTYGYVTLLGGVFLGVVYKELKAARSRGKTKVNIWSVLRGAFKQIDFWIGVFASPVVYVVLLQAVDLENISLAGILALTLVGLQNGFVCETLADSLFSQVDKTSKLTTS